MGFAEIIMPQYFNQTKYRSFQRQLYIYGFDRIKDKSSEDFGAYFHELFIRGATAVVVLAAALVLLNHRLRPLKMKKLQMTTEVCFRLSLRAFSKVKLRQISAIMMKKLLSL